MKMCEGSVNLHMCLFLLSSLVLLDGEQALLLGLRHPLLAEAKLKTSNQSFCFLNKLNSEISR